VGKDTSISWCHHTFNLWWGCWKISPGCCNCYAATFDRRVHGKNTDHWDRTGSRRFMSADYWNEPLKWNRAAQLAGERRRVFCGSMCDWAEIHPDPETNRQMDAYRGRLFELVRQTPHLDWLLLTKRTENVADFLPWIEPWPNVWIGTTVEDQGHAAQRLPVLLDIDAIVHFVSAEPLLGELDLSSWMPRGSDDHPGIEWLIAGAESGHRARRCDASWLRSLRDQCEHYGVPFFLKQAVWQAPITINLGSRIKGRGYEGAMVEMPYLDGRQHLAVPECHA
jgi:protein gp37